MKKVLTVPFFFDLKSPFSYLAKDPLRQLQKTYAFDMEYLPYDFSRRSPQMFYPDRRSEVEWLKIRYMYKDLRRFANLRDPPLVIKGPTKLFDSSIANIGSLYCSSKSKTLFNSYIDIVFEKFFQRQLEIDDADCVFEVIAGLAKATGVDANDISRDEFGQYLDNEGRKKLRDIEVRGDKMGVFGVPTVFIEDEMYFGNDRIDFVEKHLQRLGLVRDVQESKP